MRGVGSRREEFASACELLAIAGLAIAQPCLDLLSKNASVFVTEGATKVDIVLLILGIVLVPAAVAYVIELACAFAFPRARRVLHGLLVGAFFVVYIEETLKQATKLGPVALEVLATALGVVVVVLVLRSIGVRRWLRVLAVAPIAFVVVFVGFSPVTSLLFGSTAEGNAGAAITKPKRVVMIVFDEFPLESLLDGTGHVDASLFPNFAALAKTSTWYRNETSVAPLTEWAVPAIDSGQYPHDPQALPTAQDYPNTIFRLLGGAYQMHVSQAIAEDCPTSICTSHAAANRLAARVHRLVKATTQLWDQFAAPHRTAVASFNPAFVPPQVQEGLEWAAGIHPSSKPVLDYLHVLLPHRAWHYLPTLQETGSNPNDNFSLANVISWVDSWSARIGKEQHLLQLQATDALLGKIIDRLKATGVWNNSVVVVTADHGIAFDGGAALRSVEHGNADQILWTPLFIKTPDQTAGRIDDRPAQSVDVLPTVAQLIGVKIPWHVDGRSLLLAPRKEFVRHFYQWRVGKLLPPHLVVANGNGYLGFDPRVYFPKVLKARAAVPASGDPALRVYRTGPYGALIGARASPLINARVRGPSAFTVQPGQTFAHVDVHANALPWTFVEGQVRGVPSNLTMAFAVNGVIAGFGEARPTHAGSTIGNYAAVLAPQFFHDGANDVRAYVVSGPAAHPQLVAVPLGH
jgi:hypothetical protein